MIQDIAPERLDLSYKLLGRDIDIKNDDYVFIFSGRKILIKLLDDGSIEVPRYADCEKAAFEEQKEQVSYRYLFMIGEKRFFLLNKKIPCDDQKLIEGFYFDDLNVLRGDRPRVLCFAGFSAYQLFSWYSDNLFCGRCGGEMHSGLKERSLVCAKCKHTVYPKIMPAVIVALIDKDKIVMTRYKDRPYRGMALIAGFCEIGETPEDTVRREVFEEVGLKCKNIRYYASQPWGIDSDLLLGFIAEVDGDTSIVRQEDELSEALWVKREDVEQDDIHISLTRTMMANFKHGLF